LRKFGFRFFFSEGRRDIDGVTELGASQPLPVQSWQIEPRRLRELSRPARAELGVRFVDSALIRRIQLGADDAVHRVTWQRAGDDLQQTECRWLIDASGRAGLIKRQLGLAQENAHAAHAVWFRISERIEIDRWSDDPAWKARCVTPTRWLSTNHLCGAGYWVWLIPLASGSHSVGIVADPKYHPLERMNSFERAMDWLAEYQPRLFDDLDGRRDKLQDFAFFRRFSYDCKQIFCADRWALAGESGRFLDPFYSPGSDFIAIGNTFITELIARDRAGLRLPAHVAGLRADLPLDLRQHARALRRSIRPLRRCRGAADQGDLGLHLLLERARAVVLPRAAHRSGIAVAPARRPRVCQRLNIEVQGFLRAWGAASDCRNPAVMLDQAAVPWFVELNRSLQDKLDANAFRERIHAAAGRLKALAGQIVERACAEHPQLDAAVLRELITSGAKPTAAHEPMLFAPARQPA